MKLLKKFLATITMVSVLLGVSIAPALAAQPSLAIDGAAISIPSSYGTPFIDSENRMQVPIRVIAEELGANVAWDENTQTATINEAIKIQVGSATINTASGTIDMDTTAVIYDDRVYIPIRAMANALGLEVTATEQNGAVLANITTQANLAQDIFVDAQWLKNNLENVTVIDVRTAEEYAAGHIQGAINIYWTSLSNLAVNQGEKGWAEVLTADALAEALGSYGLDGETPIVIYGDPATGWGEDGRTLFTLNMAGIKDAKILDGGYSVWVAAGFPVTTDIAAVEPVDFKITNGNYRLQVDTEYVKANQEDIVLVDTRSKEEYNGETNSGEAANGRIPDAVSIYYKDLLNDDGTILASEDLQAVFQAAGLTPDDEIVTYCTGGVRAAFVAEVLKTCGYQNVKVYTAGFSEWAGDISNKIDN